MEILKGVGVAMGIAIGKALLILDEETLAIEDRIDPESLEIEVARFESAVKTAQTQIKTIKDEVKLKIGEEHAFIFDTQVMFLDDRSLYRETIKAIRELKCNAEWAFSQVLTNLLREFNALEDHYFVERGNDLKDVGRRVLRNLKGTKKQESDLKNLCNDVIIIGSEFGPSNITHFENDRILGFATDFGGHTTHTAIIARALHLPAVVGLHDITQKVNTGDLLILDSVSGKVFINPEPEILREYEQLKLQYQIESDAYQLELSEPSISKDGIAVRLQANIELAEEVDLALKNGADGIGLYRTEFLFLACDPELPTEEDHFKTYCKIAKRMRGKPCTIRTLDLGGEKFFHKTFYRTRETNPVMGLRGVRLCLKRKDIFRIQLRGLLRAAQLYPNIRIMFPLISGVGEWLMTKSFLNEVRQELQAEGLDVPDRVPLGIMIEVPSAALVADHLAREVDFFSIGTNDLIQYFLAIDRGNDDVGYLYNPFHPGILRLIQMVLRAGEEAEIDVSCCGEMAASPVLACLLVHLGLRNLSMNPTSLPRIHHAIRAMDFTALAKHLEAFDRCRSAEESQKFFLVASQELLGKETYKSFMSGFDEEMGSANSL